MKENSNDLSISWVAIHEFTSQAHTPIKDLDSKTIEIFKPRNFESEIQPRLMNLRDLSIPTDWIISDVTDKPSTSMQCS